jgi:protein-L-isoaspartate(D-aspartate) O-methyltransferase
MDMVLARKNMVDHQLRTNGLFDPALITALSETPREVFLPKALRTQAYIDDHIDLGDGRWLMAPMVLARLLQEARLCPSDVVLLIGDITGYATALVARLVSFAVSLDREPGWVQRAGAVLAGQGIGNVDLMTGPLERGLPARAPYDAILLMGAMAEVPTALPRQLSDGGRLLGVERPGPGPGQGAMVVRAGDTWGRRPLFDATVPFLPGAAPKAGFIF